MPGKPWTSADQAAFLTENLPHYLEAQASKVLSAAFWPRIFREWFEKFPEREALFPGVVSLTEEQVAQLQTALEDRHKVSQRQCIMISPVKSPVDAAHLV
jgi:hypothetical protein